MAATRKASPSKPSYSNRNEFPSVGVEFVPVIPSTFGDMIGFVNRLHQSKRLSDLKLTCRGKSYDVHRLVLASRSSYFGGILDSDEPITELTLDADPYILDLCLEYMYTGTAQVDVRRVGAVADLCHELGIIQLRNDCFEHKIRQEGITRANCLILYADAYEINDPRITDKVIPFVLDNFAQIELSTDFNDLTLDCVSSILSHSDLNVTVPDHRFDAALDWVRADPPARQPKLHSLLHKLPLHGMSVRLLRRAMKVDAILQNNPHVCSMLNNIIDEQSQAYRHGVIIMGARMVVNGKRQDADGHVVPVMTSLNYPSRSIATIPAPVPRGGDIACCMSEDMLYVSGVGDDRRGAWQCDMKTVTWRACGKLAAGRAGHCMCVSEGRVYVMGGCVPDSGMLVRCVEVMVSGSGGWCEVGQLQGAVCVNTCCCTLPGGDILVYGVWSEGDRPTLQVFSVSTHSVIHTLMTPTGGWVYGVLVTHDHIIMLSERTTLVCPVSVLYKIHSGDIQNRDTYQTPNYRSAVFLSEDHTHIISVGGDLRDDTSPHYVYRASVSDVIAGKESGWERVTVGGVLGRCRIWGGAVCSGLIPLSLFK